jgi:5'(3')-deoxyribonucleotidase
MQNKPVIALDLDEVLYPYTYHWIQLYNKKFGTNHVIDVTDLKVERSYEINKWPEFKDNEFASCLFSSRFYDDLLWHPIPEESLIFLRWLMYHKRGGYLDFFIITSRPNTAGMGVKLRDWLKHQFPFDIDIHIVGDRGTKQDIAKCWGATHLVDDKFEHLQDAYMAGLKIIPIISPWNFDRLIGSRMDFMAANGIITPNCKIVGLPDPESTSEFFHLDDEIPTLKDRIVEIIGKNEYPNVW